MTDLVLSDLKDGVLTVSLNRADKRNALTDAMYRQFADALDRAATDETVKVVIIRGEGEAFTGGNDIGDFVAISSSGMRPEDAQVFRLLNRLAHFDKPIVAAVRGVAVGIGVTMLLHCDLVYVADDARLSAPFVNLALVPEAASSLLMPLRIGHARAFSLFALGEVLDGPTAVAWGLANACVPAADVDAAALKAATALAARAPGSLKATKGLMRDAEMLWTIMERENTAFRERLFSPEAREAFMAFAQKRAPDFSKAS